METPVIFLWEKESESIFAFFPTLNNSYYKNFFTSYAHIGQHSDCVIDYALCCNVVNDSDDYKELLAELVKVGYDNLLVLNQHQYNGGLSFYVNGYVYEFNGYEYVKLAA